MFSSDFLLASPWMHPTCFVWRFCLVWGPDPFHSWYSLLPDLWWLWFQAQVLSTAGIISLQVHVESLGVSTAASNSIPLSGSLWLVLPAVYTQTYRQMHTQREREEGEHSLTTGFLTALSALLPSPPVLCLCTPSIAEPTPGSPHEEA